MKRFGRILAWILALVMLSGMGAAAESALPEIPGYSGELKVRPIRTETEAVEYAKEIWALDCLGMNFPISTYEVSTYDDDVWVVYAKDGPDDEDYCYGDVMFDMDGNVLRIENASSGAIEVLNEAMAESEDDMFGIDEDDNPENDEQEAAWREERDRSLETPFLAGVCPLVYREYIGLYPGMEDGSDTLTHFLGTYTDSYDSKNVFQRDFSETYRDENYSIEYIIQISPVVRIVYFDVYADPGEGGNG